MGFDKDEALKKDDEERKKLKEEEDKKKKEEEERLRKLKEEEEKKKKEEEERLKHEKEEQERYKAITRAYYKGAKGAFIVYDITRKETFDNIDKWRNELINSCNQEVTIMLIGNKCDLEEQRQINTEQGEEKAKSFGFSFLETSAYSGENLEKGFEMLIKEIYQKYKVEQKGNDLYDLERGEELKTGKDRTKKKCC